MRNILQYILKVLAIITIWRYKPIIIGVTGSVGKTSTKEAIYSILKDKFKTRRNIKNYNNEIGAPLTVLGSDISPETTFSGLLGWFRIFSKALLGIIYQRNYPEILVLELGVSKPGDMEYLMSFIHAKIGVFTAIGEFPSHIEFFSGKDQLVKEKSLLIKSLPDDGLAILNYDDLLIRQEGNDLPEKIETIYYGFEERADLRIENYELKADDIKKGDFGINFKLDYKGSFVPIRLVGVLGKHQVFAAAAAASVGLFFKLNLVDIAEALKDYYSLPGRTNLIKGIKQTWIIDDTYNASPTSVESGLEILNELSLKSSEQVRRIAILGDMMELGVRTEAGHRRVGKKVIETADLLFTVGDRARFIADEAKQNGFDENNIFEFSRAEDAGLIVQEKINKNDIILVKGSRSMCMEKIVKEIMAEPQKADELLI
ncbi:MAG: UDP-N-acetylmuramoyl-tripeptide--D-alanyl-D-alanine ligase [Patescibacteria group bacterium]